MAILTNIAVAMKGTTQMSKKAMKMALDALEENHHLIEEHERPDYLAHYDRVISEVAKALAKQEQGETVAVWELQETGWETICDGDWLMTLPIGTRLYYMKENT
jgi:hypothetical protein